MRNSGISGKYRFQLVYKVRHQSPKKSMAKPTPLRSSMMCKMFINNRKSKNPPSL